jgi:predicted ArsR family transcriptional regulator
MAMLIVDKIMGVYARFPGKALTIPELAAALGVREQYVRTGILVLLASGDIVATGGRQGHGRRAVEYSINKDGK